MNRQHVLVAVLAAGVIGLGLFVPVLVENPSKEDFERAEQNVTTNLDRQCGVVLCGPPNLLLFEPLAVVFIAFVAGSAGIRVIRWDE